MEGELLAGFHVRQRGKAGRWYAVIDLGRGPDGKRKQKWIALSKDIRTKREAESEARKLAVKRDEGQLLDDRRMTVAQLLERWCEYRNDNWSPSTRQMYREHIENHIVPLIGHLRISKVTPLEIEEFYRQLMKGHSGKRPLQPQTVGVIHAICSGAFKLAVKWELLTRNPFQAVSKPTGEPKPKVVLDDDQFRRFVRELAGTRMAMPALMLGATGLRRSELLALKWSHLDLDNGVVRVEEGLVRTGGGYVVKRPKSKKGVRQVPLSSLVVSALRAYKAEQDRRREEAGPAWVDHDLVFDDGLGEYWRPSTFSAALSAAARRAGIPHLTPHALRHTFASIVYDRTGDMKLVQELLGHSTLAVTADIYTHTFEARKRKAAEIIESIFTVTDNQEHDERPVH